MTRQVIVLKSLMLTKVRCDVNKDNLSFITDEQVKKMIEITTTFSLNKWLYMVRQAKFRRNAAWCIVILREKERCKQ